MNLLRWIELLVFFLKEVVMANLQVAQLLLRGASAVNPALVEIPLRVKSPRDIYLLTSMITLTPGTLSVEVEGDSLLVHVIDASDPNQVIRSIQEGFEDRLLRLASKGGSA